MKPQLVFIPGLISDERAWQAVAERLDFAGYPTKIADVTQAASLQEMAAHIVSEQSTPFIPIGHSMGGRVVFEIYRSAPEMCLALGLVATGAHPLAESELPKRQEVINLANTEGMAALCDIWLPPMLHPDTQADQPELYKSLRQMVLDAGPEVHERQIKALVNRPDAIPLLSEISCPTLLVAGEADGWSSPQQHEKMMSMMVRAKAQLEVITGAGHFLEAERPEAFAKVLSNWLDTLNQ